MSINIPYKRTCPCQPPAICQLERMVGMDKFLLVIIRRVLSGPIVLRAKC